jgi:hypothetical protein
MATTTFPAAFPSRSFLKYDEIDFVARRPHGKRPASTCAARAAKQHRATWMLPDDSFAVPAGRRLVRMTLAEWELHDRIDVVELLASELITNAVQHAWGAPLLTLSLRDGLLRCEVEDANPELPQEGLSDSCDESGRGLHILELLSRRWGFDRTDMGKAVWFEISARSGIHVSERSL